MHIQDIDQKPSEESSRHSAVQEHAARFLSVVDIAEENVRRQIRDKTVEESEDKDYRQNEDISFHKGLTI